MTSRFLTIKKTYSDFTKQELVSLTKIKIGLKNFNPHSQDAALPYGFYTHSALETVAETDRGPL